MVIALGTVLAIAGVGATAVEVGMEGAKAAQGQESVFDFVTGRTDPEEKFMDKCRRTGGAFPDCPDLDYGPPADQNTEQQEQQKDVDQSAPEDTEASNSMGQNVMLLGGFVLFLLFVKML